MEPRNYTEKERLDALYNLNILGVVREPRFDRITKAASMIFGLPIAGIGLVDTDAVVFKSVYGIKIEEIPKPRSFSEQVVSTRQLVLVEDVEVAPQYKENALVKTHNVRFYAGVPIKTHDGFVLGDFFIADRHPRKLNDLQKNVLADMCSWVEDELLKGKMLTEEQRIKNDLISRNQELAREKARADAMLADIGDGVVGINDKGEIIFANSAAEVMTGFNEDELRGKLLIQSLRLVDSQGVSVPAANQPIRQALFYRKRVMNEQYFLQRADGTRFPVAITATPVIVFNQTIGGVVIFRDITKEKEVDRMKTEFISLASHQLRTPLSAMKWFGEILLDGDAGELSKEQKDIVNNIYKSNQRMIDLVNTLLNISRIESGRIIIDPQPTDLKKLIDDVILEVRPRLEQKKHHLAFSIHGSLPIVYVDPKLVRHVYMNLLTNAIKYTREGGDIVIIVSKNDGEVISQVSDNGFGIPAAEQRKVFDKFFRAENVVKIETEGTGLGLYLAKAIVESSGGRIWFKSVEGKGTTFWFSMPVRTIKKKGEVSIDS